MYDGLGRRVQATAGGITTLSFYGHGGELFWQQTPTQKHAYVRLAGSLVAQLDYPAAGGAASVKYQHTDALGTPVAETDANRAVTRERMTSYGEPVDGTYSDGPGYTGHVTDAASKLTYMQQRYYDPVIGRFISADPLAADTAGANFNRYKYSANNPHTFYDPDGRLERTVGSRIPGGTAGRSVTGAAGVGELGRLRLSNRNAAGGYSTPDDAATAQFAAHESEYQETGSSEELLGAIAEKKIDGQVRYFFSTMIVVRAFSFKGALTVDMGTGFTRVALSHTHPGANGGQEFFSIDDAKFVGKIGSEKYPARMPYYLRTPLGDVRVLSPTTGGALRMQGGRLVNPEHRLPAYGNQDN